MLQTPHVVNRDDAVPDTKTPRPRLDHSYNHPEVTDDLNRKGGFSFIWLGPATGERAGKVQVAGASWVAAGHDGPGLSQSKAQASGRLRVCGPIILFGGEVRLK